MDEEEDVLRDVEMKKDTEGDSSSGECVATLR